MQRVRGATPSSPAFLLHLRARGFTLLELILVLLIISVASALVGPALGTRLLRADARRTAIQLRSVVDYMRVKAVRSGQEEVMVIDPQDNTYWREGSGETIEVPPESGFLSARSRWIRENGQVEFHFYPDGTNSGGAIRVEQGRGAAATAYLVVLDPLLGLASIVQDE
ncbi:MAG TPA: prepilin-type N-terminal cleavage/methylation domain-containing protein [Methylomirabilota bacterium]|nr:prepilin-type N-terminal cleavage/methylation domain-containing protein [Methylomirabilota bacterium]